MNSNIKTAIFWVVLICVAVLLWAVVRTGNTRKDQQLTFSQFLTEVESGRVKQVSIAGNEVHGAFKDDASNFHTLIDRDQALPSRSAVNPRTTGNECRSCVVKLVLGTGMPPQLA